MLIPTDSDFDQSSLSVCHNIHARRCKAFSKVIFSILAGRTEKHSFRQETPQEGVNLTSDSWSALKELEDPDHENATALCILNIIIISILTVDVMEQTGSIATPPRALEYFASKNHTVYHGFERATYLSSSPDIVLRQTSHVFDLELTRPMKR